MMDKKVGMELGNVADSNITPEIDEEKIQTMFGEQEELLKFLSEFRVDEELFAKVVLERDALKFLFREYKELEEQGLLLRLPCKVGDTIYSVRIRGRDRKGNPTYSIAETKFDYFWLDEMGEWAFLTREEAEQKLKEMGE